MNHKMTLGDSIQFSYKGHNYHEARDLLERSLVLAALEETGGVKYSAAILIGVSMTAFRKMVKRIPQRLLDEKFKPAEDYYGSSRIKLK